MKRYAKASVVLLLALLLVIIPFQTTHAAEGDRLYYSIIWHGGDPTSIGINISQPGPWGVYQAIRSSIIGPLEYIGKGEWRHEGWSYWTPDDESKACFVGVSRASVDGKWYVNKWDWNNVIYQPGQYMEGDSTNRKYSFYLTSSAPTTNHITINRNWSASSPAVDTQFVIYRRYTINSENRYEIVQTIDLSKDLLNITINDMYGGEYYIVQNLPSRYRDDSTLDGSLNRNAIHVTLTDGTAANVTFTNTYDAPVVTYAVGIGALSGGSISASSSQVAVGETVSLTITPDSDKQLKAGTLKYNDGTNDHIITGTSFVMPSAEVTVTAEFERKKLNVSTGSISGGTMTASPSSLYSGETVTLTPTANEGKMLSPNSVYYRGTSGNYLYQYTQINGLQFTMPAYDVQIVAQFVDMLAITTQSLPSGTKKNTYSATILATGGVLPYEISAKNLPDGLAFDQSTGVISGVPTKEGIFQVEFTLKDSLGSITERTIPITIYAANGNGAYRIVPVSDAAYTAGAAEGGLPTMTVNAGVSGFKYFAVTVIVEKGHSGTEVLLFVHKRNGQQIGMMCYLNDFDLGGTPLAAFNVKPGDVIEVYMVDSLSNGAGMNPNIL